MAKSSKSCCKSGKGEKKRPKPMSPKIGVKHGTKYCGGGKLKK